MGINFSPLSIGQSALRANGLGIKLAGQNIANVNTPGYTKQDVELSATPGYDSHFPTAGAGVSVDGIRSFRDQFVESRLLTETGISGRLTAQRDALSSVETVFSAAGSADINSAITSFFGSFRDLETNPTSLPFRQAAIDSGQRLGDAFSSTRSSLVDIRDGIDKQLRSTVDDVNKLSSKVAALNAQIGVAQNGGGGSLSELLDQRGEAVRSLVELTGGRVTTNEDSSVTVSLGDGKPLVLADRAFSLKTVSTPPSGLADIRLNGQPAVINNGRLKGLQDAITETNKSITGLDDLAASIASRVNTAHSSGSDLDGNSGTAFFEVPAGGAPITAANLKVSSAIKANPRLIVTAASGAGNGDATVARQIAGLLTDKSSTAGSKTGSFTSIYGSIVSDAGEAVSSTADSLSIQQVILSQTIEQREAASGVSLDEEAVNLLRYQRAFEAAARFLKVADEVTQTIITLGQ